MIGSTYSCKKIDSVANVLKVGDVLEAKIVGIDEENHKVSLSSRALLPEAEEAQEEPAAEETVAEATEEAAE